jgi:aminoglycoside phosphotransferase (APT) family kinase protein
MGRDVDSLTDKDTLNRIWDAHGLGAVRTISPAKRGMNNRATVVNDTHVIRFDLLDLEGICRYQGEAMAYERLRAAGIPAPEVVALDVSKTLIPYHYIILSKIDGIPLIDDWASLSESQKVEAGRAAGRYLAMMHNLELEGFGHLENLQTTPFARWFDFTEDYWKRYVVRLLAAGIIDTRTHDRMRSSFERLRPRLDSFSAGRLVHADYQFENLLHRDGVITGIIDFEWAVSGDPAWDFRLENQWDIDCPGSARFIREGYTRLRPLPDDHDIRVWLYKMVFYVDNVEMLIGGAGQEDSLALYLDHMMKALEAVERTG